MDVEIFGNKYDIKGDVDFSHIKMLSEYLDKKMVEVSDKNTKTISTLKIAILAALTISNDLFELKETYNTNVNKAEKKIDTLISVIEKKLP